MAVVLAYLVAVVVANLTVAHLGPISAIPVALIAIGFDLTARDILHERWKRNKLWLKLFVLIGTGSTLSYLINQNSYAVSLASFVAFASAGGMNSLVYYLLDKCKPIVRVNASNICASLVDSLIFPTIAFGGFIWWVSLGQFIAKALGGFIWFALLRRYVAHWKG
jgi:queuosine precursor transporter